MEVPQLIQRINFNSTFAVFDLIAVFLFATSGALAAIRKKYDFIGVLMLAFFPASEVASFAMPFLSKADHHWQ